MDIIRDKVAIMSNKFCYDVELDLLCTRKWHTAIFYDGAEEEY